MFEFSMTGRKNRVVSNEDGTISYESRSKQDVPLELLNIAEKKRFMDGEKNVAVISEAASSGVSLQADRRAKNQRRCVHITLELPWSADKAIQQFGRSHRSNQASAPEYLFLISELAGEKRFASIVAKRLESLGALTHGDRRATESQDLSRYNFDNKVITINLL
ncbi:protein strawberry notch homolog 1-like [Acropora millepora]|uniref:protein strawberry notch homolog 1-like n=1 Tax=Acropora millepora TaxID=45264 RepID=UPI001CF3FA67|nr:protein strawberry notch homolog 1-like [Acropora millepora]